MSDPLGLRLVITAEKICLHSKEEPGIGSVPMNVTQRISRKKCRGRFLGVSVKFVKYHSNQKGMTGQCAAPGSVDGYMQEGRGV